MQTPRTLFFSAFSLFSLCLLCPQTFAQGQAAPAEAERATVVASAAAERVRFAAPNRVARLRLEVLSASGDVLFEANSRGSVLDWTLSDAQGNRLADGSYLCVVTVKDVTGRMTQRLTLVGIAGGVAAVRAASAADLTPRQAEAIGPVEAEAGGVEAGAEAPAATLLAHDGREGQLVTTAGDLSFRGGDFFTGRDKELMRLRGDGSLEVAGLLLSRGGIRFSDGTVLESAAGVRRQVKGGKGARAAAGGDDAAAPAATANRLAKFADSAGTLADSVVVESGGNVGVGTASPATRLDLIGDLTLRVNPGSLGFLVGDRVTDPGRQMVYGAARGSGYSVLNTFVQGSTLAAPAISQFTAWTSDINLDAANAEQFLFGNYPALGGVVATIGYGQGAGRNITIQANWNPSTTPNALVVAATGNVGVGTASPQHRLDVAGSLRLSGAGSGIVFPDGSVQTSAGSGAGGLSGSGTAGTVPLWTGPSALGNSVITQSGGNVGIGTGVTASKLEVAGGAGGGVSASSTGGFALYGSNPSGWAVGAEGNARQSRDRGGFVKAMIYVDRTGAITRCFNSFEPDGGASLAGCGFTVSRPGPGVYTVGFPFAVHDRFYSLAAKAASTTESPRLNTGANFEFDVNPNSLLVSTFLIDAGGTQTSDASFMLVVY